MASLICVAATSLNQWAMDFDSNLKRIIGSVEKAKRDGARYRFGPELEICGYGCADHYFEEDTILHSWEALAKIIADRSLDDIVIDTGMPVLHKSCLYNCRIVILNGKILGIAPKKNLANDGGNYREMRYFVSWKSLEVDELRLPSCISNVHGQKTCPIGMMVFQTAETVFGVETCEDMWTLKNPHIDLFLQGAELIFNSSASHFSLQKYWDRRLLTSSASLRFGGLYGFCNTHGCDGDRLYFEGETFFVLNGEIVERSELFSLKDVQCLTCAIDLNDIRASRRTVMSSMNGASLHQTHTTIKIVDLSHFSLKPSSQNPKLSLPIVLQDLIPEEEISHAPAKWLWDYLRRSSLAGFFLPLSGGIDSASVACLVAFMCHHLVKEISDGNEQVLSDVRKVVGEDNYAPVDRRDLASRLLYTCYMATENSSDFTRNSASSLAQGVGSTHRNIVIDLAVNAVVSIFQTATGFVPKFKAHEGSNSENLALQNIQARLRMVFAYLFAQLSVYVKTGKEGSLLVLGSGNVDEALRGYLTKYDCSSADINPIGGISKTDLRKFILYTSDQLDIPILKEIYKAPPTAELEPLNTDGAIQQTDEDDMGMTYDELSIYGRLRKSNKCGPYSMYLKLVHVWTHLSPLEVARKVKYFFRMYSINRHKQTVLTPSVHMENYSPDDNRFDLRQFLYNVNWPWQFRAIDRHASETKEK